MNFHQLQFDGEQIWDVLNEEKQQAIRGGVIIFRIDQEKSYNSSGSKQSSNIDL